MSSTRQRLLDTFEAGLAAATTETRALKGAVRTLAEKIEEPCETAARDRAIKALERDVAAMAGHLAGAEKGFAALARFEQSIGRLLGQMEQTRGTIAGGSDAHERRMAREAAELRAARDEADNRIHLASSVAPETVGAVVDPPAWLAAVPGSTRPTHHAPAPTMAQSPERRAHSDPAKGVAARGAFQPGALATATPDPALPRKNPPAGEPDSASAEIDDLLIEPGAGFSPRAPKRRLPAPPASAQDAGRGGRREDSGGLSDSAAPTWRVYANGEAREPAPRLGGDGAFFDAVRKPITFGVAALSLALAAYALAGRSDALKGFDPPAMLKTIGASATGEAIPLERRSVTAGGSPASPTRSAAAPLPAHILGLLDPAAFESGHKNPSVAGAAPLKAKETLHAMAGSVAVMPARMTARASAAEARSDQLRRRSD